MSGFLGRHLAALATSRSHTVIGYSRQAIQVEGCREMRMIRHGGSLSLAGVDAVVNLAGESILGLWTSAKKRRILQSRIGSTRSLVEAIAEERAATGMPATLLNASATGFYGNTGDRIVDERSPRGSGFLAETTGLWESEAIRARDAGIRVALLRIGFVLGREGGAMPILKRVFGLGLGGKLGNGRQYMSWIHVEDVVRIILYAVENSHVEGALNLVAPEPLTNAAFTKALARAARRPALLPAPAFAMRLVLGEMSSLALDSSRVVSRDLRGFPYCFPKIDSALAQVFGNNPA